MTTASNSSSEADVANPGEIFRLYAVRPSWTGVEFHASELTDVELNDLKHAGNMFGSVHAGNMFGSVLGRIVARRELGGVLVRARSERRDPIDAPAFAVPFEPIHLRDREPRLRELADATPPEHPGQRWHPPQPWTYVSPEYLYTWKFLLPMFTCVFWFPVLKKFGLAEIAWWYAFAFPLLAVVVWAIRYTFRWYIAPRCVVPRPAVANAQLRVYTTDNAYLEIDTVGKQHRATLGRLRSPIDPVMLDVTPREAQALIAAWTSPLPPPSESQLVEWY